MGIFQKKSSEKGQILLVVVLAAVVSLTVGLAAVSRTITNTRITNDETDSQKALAAAEAGIEKQIGNPVSNPPALTFGNSASATVTNTSISGQEILMNGGSTIDQDDGIDVWLSTYPTYLNPWTGNLRIYWSDNSAVCTDNAALEVYLLYNSSTDPDTSRYAFDVCASRVSSNSFATVDPLGRTIGTSTYTILGETFNHYVTIPVTAGIVARVIPLYADTRIAVQGYTSANIPQNLPSQGSIIESIGTSGTASRKVRVFQGYPKLPNEFFAYSLFVPSP